MLQLGFLKMLKGSKIREQAQLHQYEYRQYPPYEVLSNSYLSYDDLIVLKGVEDLVEKYYNSGRFVKSLNYIITTLAGFKSPFQFYLDFYQYCDKKNLLGSPVAARDLYGILYGYLKDLQDASAEKLLDLSYMKELMKYDVLASDRSGYLPKPITRYMEKGFKESCINFLSEQNNIDRYLPKYKGVRPEEIMRKVRFEIFRHNDESKTVLFDHSEKDRVTGLYPSFFVSLDS